MANAGCLALAKDTLKASLADCDSFRTWVDASGGSAQDQALNRIHKDDLPPPGNSNAYTLAELQALRPFAIIYTAGGFRKEYDASPAGFENMGTLAVLLEQDVPERIKNDPAAIADEFETVIGQIMDNLCDLVDQAPYLSITAITMPEEWVRSDPKSEPDFGDAAMAMLFIEHKGI